MPPAVPAATRKKWRRDRAPSFRRALQDGMGVLGMFVLLRSVCDRMKASSPALALRAGEMPRRCDWYLAADAHRPLPLWWRDQPPELVRSSSRAPGGLHACRPVIPILYAKA